MVIYADILLVVNWWIDFLLLLGVRRLMALGTRGWRLAIGAFVGALFSLILLLPPMSMWLSLSLKLLAAGLMVLLAFGWHNRRQYIKALCLLFGISAGMSGLCSALYHFSAPRNLYVDNGIIYYAVSPWLLIGLTVLCYALMALFEYIVRRRAPSQLNFIVHVHKGVRFVSLKCLYDSGNHLSEPFSNRPVLVAERGMIQQLLSVPESIDALPPDGMWRVVPFESIGGEGLLPAFLPDCLDVITPQGKRTIGSCYVAVCDRIGHGDYNGLIGSALGDQIL